MESVFVGQQQSSNRTIRLGDDPQPDAGIGQGVGGKNAESLFHREFILAPVVLSEFSPITRHMTLKEIQRADLLGIERRKCAGRGILKTTYRGAF